LAGGALYVTTFAGASANSSNLGQVRKVNLADSVVTTVAGVATQAASPTNGTQIDGTPAQSVFQFGVYVPAGNDTVNRSSVAVASDGTLYVTDTYNDALRVIDPVGVTTTIVYGIIATPNGDGVVINRALFGGLSAEMAIAVDVSGNVVVCDSSDHDIRRVTAAGSVSTVAGLHNRPGQVDAKGTAAMFARPDGIAAAPDGTLFVADTNGSAIRRIAPDGTVTTFAGTLGATGSADGLGNAAQFYQPRGIVRDSSGSLYVADSAGTTIRRIDIAGNVTTIAGTPLTTGSVDGVGPAARFSAIYGLAIDAAGVFYAADAGNNAIRKFTAGGVVSTVVGASGTTAQQGLANPHGVAVGADGTIYVADTANYAVRAVSPAGVITTLIGASSDNFTRVGADPRIGTPTGIAVLGPKSLAVTGDRVYGGAVLTSVFVLTLP
jgi:sugar lactone lactonase YvrE